MKARLLLICIAASAFTVATFAQPCPPTPLPFLDNFDSPELDPCWEWIREDTSHWSLTERPGWMRIVAQYGQDNDINRCCLKNKLLRILPDANLRITTQVALNPVMDYQQAGLLVYVDEDNYLSTARSHDAGAGGQVAYLHHEVNGAWDAVFIPETDSVTFLRLDKIGTSYTAFAGSDSVNWHYIGQYSHDYSVGQSLMAGVFAETGREQGVGEIPADFDYFRVDPLPGTTVCGEVSGIWDSTGSPYYVTCDVTVPAGQTLEIRPGVQVLFTGHYKFSVNGNLQAIGTEQDSIVFTRAFPTEESKWWHVDIFSPDTARFEFVVVEFGHATDYNRSGGGIVIGNDCVAIVDHCTVRHCSAYDGGAVDCIGGSLIMRNSCLASNHADVNGGAVSSWGALLVFEGCQIHDNSCGNGGGGVSVDWAGSAMFRSCVIRNNQAGVFGGAIAHQSGSTSEILNCTVTANSAPTTAGIWGTALVRNSIVYFNNSTQVSGVTATYSDIEGGYPGTGNIDADPMFVDSANGDFHLLWNSPCIDSGDPTSPLDPDSTRADMGAFPYLGPRLRVVSPNGGESWTLYESAVVQWIGTGFVGNVTIELDRNYPSEVWDILAYDTPNDSEETVFVADPVSSQCRVRVSAVEDAGSDISDADFSIVSSQGYLALVRIAQPTVPVLSWNAGIFECPDTGLESFRLKNFGTEEAVSLLSFDVSANFGLPGDCNTPMELAPGEMSTCSLAISYDPQSNGTHLGTLAIRTNAINAETDGFLRIPLSGTQLATPATPQVVITTQGPDAVLHWNPVAQSIGGCDITVTGYLVFYSSLDDGTYEYHGFTTDTSYTHVRVLQFAPGMFYQVMTYTGARAAVMGLSEGMKEEEVWRKLR